MVTTILRGGLGNNLFQIAAVLGYALKHNIDYCIPTKIENPHLQDQRVFYSKNLIYCNIDLTNSYTYKEPFFHYQEIPKINADVIVLDGYFQSWKYFDEYRNEILKILDIPYEKNKGSISIHYRLGDYRNLQDFHPPVTLGYIHAAINYFKDLGYKKFIVFSDEIDFCFDNIIQPEDCIFKFSMGRNELDDLILMSGCEGQICSNSSYALWGAYLNRNENKRVVMPQKWFGNALPNDTKDLYFPNSIII